MIAALWAKVRWYVIGAAAVLALLAGAFAAGRYSVPTKVTETATTTAKADTTWAMLDKYRRVEAPVQIVTHTVYRPSPEAAPQPAGCPACSCPPIQETTVTETHGPVTTTAESASSGSSETTASTQTTKVIENARAGHALELGASWPVKDPKLRPSRLDAALGARVAGPLWLAATAAAPTDRLGDARSYSFGLRARVEF